jgi:hypothetical protein
MLINDEIIRPSIVVATLLLMATAAAAQPAQQQSVDSLRLKAYEGLVVQRNQAMDALAYMTGEMKAQLDALTRQLEEARKQCPAAAPKNE